MSKKIVIIGGGLSAKHAAEELLKGKNSFEVTIVQANKFVEWPLPMTMILVKPELHDKALATDCSVFQVPGATYKYGVVARVDAASKQVVLADKESVAYDALIVATGFNVPCVYPGLGVTVEERKAQVQQIGSAIKNATCVVVGGGGLIALEMVGNIRGEYPDKKVQLLCTPSGILKAWPLQKRMAVEEQLKSMKIEVIKGSGNAPTEYSLEPGWIDNIKYDVYLPSFSQGPNTKFLASDSALLDDSGRLRVNSFLQSEVSPQIFAIGVSNADEPCIVMPKLEAQWKSVTSNVVAMLDGTPLNPHKEGAPFMKLPPMLLIGHGSTGYAYIDFDNMPPPVKVCCCGGYCGFPCCPPCWPCCACAGCGACPCGWCLRPAEGTGPSMLAAKMAFKSGTFHFNGLGQAPKQQAME